MQEENIDQERNRMKNIATAVITSLLLSACNQGQQGQQGQQQAYYPSQQYNSQQPQQQQYQQPQQQQLQQAVPAAPPVAPQVAAPSHAHAAWAGEDWSDGEGAALVIRPLKAGKYDVQMNLGEGYYVWNGYDSGRSIMATRGSEIIEISAARVPFRDDGIVFTECLAVKGITDFCR